MAAQKNIFLIGILLVHLDFQVLAKNLPLSQTNEQVSPVKTDVHKDSRIGKASQNNYNDPRRRTQEAIDELQRLYGAFSPASNRRQKRDLSLSDANDANTGQPKEPVDNEEVQSVVPETKIIGGTPSPPDRWPWSVALRVYPFGYTCSGTIIDKRWILTAAHCYTIIPEATVYAHIGAWNLTANDQKDIVAVEQIIIHPDFQPMKFFNDIALLKLVRDANVSSTDILALPDFFNDMFPLNPNCFIIGWGVTDPNANQTSGVLNELAVNVINHVECQIRWNEAFSQPTIYDSNLCIDEGIYGNISACHGDSGSPLQCFDTMEGRWNMAGFSSWGSSACHTYPSVYTSVQSFLVWIYQTTQQYPLGI